jgi:hypothetical protein
MHLSMILSLAVFSGVMDGIEVPSAKPVVRLVADAASPEFSFLSWDTEGGSRASRNLLYESVSLWLRVGGAWISGAQLAPETLVQSEAHTAYRMKFEGGGTVDWHVRQEKGMITFRFVVDKAATVESMRIVFPFDPRAAATTVIPSAWTGQNAMQLPAIISAPDFGQMLLSSANDVAFVGSLHGQRAEVNTVDFRLEWKLDAADQEIALQFEPVFAPIPEGFQDEALWKAIRRGWFNMLQPSAQWGTEGRPQYAPPGLLANNVVSDPVSCVIHMKADHVLLAPELAPGVRATNALRNTLDWWLDHGIEESGEMRSWRNVRGMLDANAGPLIGAWCYVEASGDRAWLLDRIGVLERLADYLAKRDIDDDGLVESVYSGNYGTQIGRLGGSAYDTINSGHKDAYSNALIYRAWRGMADLERQLGREEGAERYRALAKRLKAAYKDELYNPATGWMAWWRSEDGELHDLASPMITSIAIMYDLIDVESGRVMLEKLWEKIEAVGFTRFDLGVPLTLDPVRKGDYQQPKPGKEAGKYGRPVREDGSDTFQQYLNGGCMVSDAYYFMSALHIVGEEEKADAILHAMLKRQVEGVFANGGGFQNGVIDRYPHGAEFYDWKGNTCGYEGHLVYSFTFLQAALLRDPAMRNKLLRPLNAAGR